MEERRKFPRLNYNVEVEWIKLKETVESGAATNIAKNISGGGVCLPVDESVAVQDTLALTIKLPTREWVSSKGIVRWVESFGIAGEKNESRYEAGIEFIDINDQDRKKIKQFIFAVTGTKEKDA